MVKLDAMIARLAQRQYRRVLNFPETSAGVSLPKPSPGKKYLLYLHIPFCTVLCPFCPFHRVKFRQDSAATYFERLHREIDRVTADGYKFDEAYFGGGTPTVMPGELTATIRILRDRHPIDGVSVETNPDDLQKDLINDLRSVGVNRLSVGVQSFDDELLSEMGRFEKYGSGTTIRQRLLKINHSFDTINVDMIFNLPHQSEASIRRDLDILIDDLGIDQVSFYPLMPAITGKKTLQWSLGRIDRSRERGLYEMIAERMLAAGYERSSAWCFSRKAGLFDEYIAEREEYVGLGSGSFSYLRGTLFASTFSLNHYCRLAGDGRLGTSGRREMSAQDQMRYYLLMKLFGGSLDRAVAERRFDGRFSRHMWPLLLALRLIGAITIDADKITLTQRGQYIWIVLMREFFTGVNSLREQMRHHIRGESQHFDEIHPDIAGPEVLDT